MDNQMLFTKADLRKLFTQVLLIQIYYSHHIGYQMPLYPPWIIDGTHIFVNAYLIQADLDWAMMLLLLLLLTRYSQYISVPWEVEIWLVGILHKQWRNTNISYQQLPSSRPEQKYQIYHRLICFSFYHNLTPFLMVYNQWPVLFLFHLLKES